MNIGDRMGDYEIVDVLGAGGMGRVLKVKNVVSERIEAMKILLPNLESDPALADRFLREIKTQAALDHPNIAKLNTAMRVDNQLVMIMEFVEGTSLAQLLEKGPIDAPTCVSYTAQILDALGYAHKQGVVHRDIKPANIMVTADGHLKLLDFGIARVKGDQRLTQTGGAVGSLHYMSPEQIRGEEPDARSDIYSLGITLYEMVTGRRPFRADSDFQLMSAHLQQAPVAPIEIVPGVPPSLSEIILMAISKDPAQRFQSAEAFRGALSSLGIALPPQGAVGVTTKTVTPDSIFVTAARSLPTPPSPPPGGPPTLPSIRASNLASSPANQVSNAQPSPVPPPGNAPPSLPNPAFAQAPPPPPVSAKQVTKSTGGKRTLYMALGSIATLAVLVAAVIEGPKLMHGGNSKADAQSAPAIAAPPPASDPTPAAPEPVTQDPAAQEPAAPTPVPQAPVAQTPAPQNNSRPTARPVPQNLTPTNIVAPALAPSRPVEPAAAPTQVSPAQAPPAQPPAAQNNAPSPKEFAEIRERFNSDTIRASTAKDGLASIESQMSRQGLGLRGDIREARTRADYQLQEARAAMAAGDLENAKQSLRYAESAIQTIEKFLGR